MFDIGFIEMLVIGLILLLVVGPERLPEVARTVGGWVHQAKSYVDSMKSEIDRDLQLSELDQQTRRATETERSLEPNEKGARGQGGAEADSDLASADETGEAAAQVEESGQTAASEGAGEEAGGPADGGEADAPDPEDQAASDLERELKEDDDQRDEDRRG